METEMKSTLYVSPTNPGQVPDKEIHAIEKEVPSTAFQSALGETTDSMTVETEMKSTPKCLAN